MPSEPQPAFSNPKILVALDYDNQSACMALVERLNPQTCRLKIGKELFTTCGPAVVEAVQNRGFEVFLDLKFHDIPATVAKAVRAAANLGVWMVNVHASGGEKMLMESANILAGLQNPPLLIGVTVLTSMSEIELLKTGVSRSLNEQVQYLAELSRQCGLSGVVCSAREASALKASQGQDFVLVTPGIRPAGTSLDDQQRVMTPVQAVQAGSDYLVIGRPITQAQEPAAVCEQIHNELAQWAGTPAGNRGI